MYVCTYVLNGITCSGDHFFNVQVEEFEKAHSEGGLERARALMHRCDPKSDVRMFNDIGTQFISMSWSNLFDVLHVVCKYVLASFLTGTVITGGTIKSSGPHVHGLQQSVPRHLTIVCLRTVQMKLCTAVRDLILLFKSSAWGIQGVCIGLAMTRQKHLGL